MNRLWRIWLWKDDALERRILDAGVISVSRDDLGHLTPELSDEELEQRIRAAQPGKGDGAYKQFVRFWRCFLAMAPGDYVLVSISDNRATAVRLLGPFEQDDEAPIPELRYFHRVELLLDSPRPKGTLPHELEKRRDLPPTVMEITYPNCLAEFLGWLEVELER